MEMHTTEKSGDTRIESHEQAIILVLNPCVLKRPTTTTPRVTIMATVGQASIGFLAVWNTYSSRPGVVA
jgi:hypothetical protein